MSSSRSLPARPIIRLGAWRRSSPPLGTRSQIDGYTAFVGQYGAKGLAYIKVNDAAKSRDGLQSPILKFLPNEVIAGIMQRTGAQTGDLIFFGADAAKVVNDSLGALRLKLGDDLKFKQEAWKMLWVVDFPMFDYDADAKRWVALHHPFTSPKTEDLERVDLDPANVKARAYDMVLNGSEIGGGSIRIHRVDVQEKVFAALGIGPEEARAKFGFLLDALRYGAPPHGGIAFGLDRLCALMSGVDSIRDVIAFPKTQKASCLMTDAPSTVDEMQLRELHIKVLPGAKFDALERARRMRAMDGAHQITQASGKNRRGGHLRMTGRAQQGYFF